MNANTKVNGLDARLRRVGYHLTRRTLDAGSTVWFVAADSPWVANGYHCRTLAEVRELCQALTECHAKRGAVVKYGGVWRCHEIDEAYQYRDNERY